MWRDRQTGYFFCEELDPNCGASSQTFFDVAGSAPSSPLWEALDLYDEDCCRGEACTDPVALADAAAIDPNCGSGWSPSCSILLQASRGPTYCPYTSRTAVPVRLEFESGGMTWALVVDESKEWSEDNSLTVADSPGAVFDMSPSTHLPDSWFFTTRLAGENNFSRRRMCFWPGSDDHMRAITSVAPYYDVEYCSFVLEPAANGRFQLRSFIDPDDVRVACAPAGVVGLINACFEHATASDPPPPTDFTLSPAHDRRVFVSEATFRGNAVQSDVDAACQSEANQAGLSGQFIAWWSVPGFSALVRIDDARYVRVDGEIVGVGRADFADGALAVPIRFHADGSAVGSSDEVWTKTRADGSDDNNLCIGLSGFSSGVVGRARESDSAWTDAFTDNDCVNSRYAVYCFEVE